MGIATTSIDSAYVTIVMGSIHSADDLRFIYCMDIPVYRGLSPVVVVSFLHSSHSIQQYIRSDLYVMNGVLQTGQTRLDFKSWLWVALHLLLQNCPRPRRISLGYTLWSLPQSSQRIVIMGCYIYYPHLVVWMWTRWDVKKFRQSARTYLLWLFRGGTALFFILYIVNYAHYPAKITYINFLVRKNQAAHNQKVYILIDHALLVLRNGTPVLPTTYISLSLPGVNKNLYID